jgi:hypothetical protein
MGSCCSRRARGEAEFVLATSGQDVLDPIPSVKAYRPSTTSKDLTELLDIADDASYLPRSEAANAEVRRRIVSGLFA